MIGKLFLFALIGIAFAEEYGLEDVIRRGLIRAENHNRNGVRRIEAALNEVSFKSDLIQTKTNEFILKSVRTQDGVIQALRNIARAMEEKAREIKAPQSVFECIKRVETNSDNQVVSFSVKFQTDVRRLEATKLANIKTDTKPLDGMKSALEVRYERAVKQVKACKNASCVDIAVNSFAKWLDLMFADMKRITGQVTTIFNNFQRDASTFLNNSNRQISRVRSSASRNLRQCLYSREDIFGDN